MHCTQILPAGACKGTGVEELLKALDVPAANIMALGDGENDIDMLRVRSHLTQVPVLLNSLLVNEAASLCHAILSSFSGFSDLRSLLESDLLSSHRR